ncbi:hypothetical protein HY479_02605 [Candidatus Uhrbacteria bacterium]|nr:hypothetical protein [Candidatus Uhrbacteria bacterium]
MLNWIIERKLKRIGKRADPPPAFVSAMEKRILVELPARTPFRAWKLAAGSLTSASLVLAGTGAYAYTSEDVVPEHPLYPVREAIERADAALARSPERRAEVEVKNLMRRLNEQRVMERRNAAVSPEQVKRFEGQLDTALQQLDRVQTETQEKLDRRVDRLEKAYSASLERLEMKVKDEQKKEALKKTLDEHRERVQRKIETLNEERRKRFELREAKLKRTQERLEYIRDGIKQPLLRQVFIKPLATTTTIRMDEPTSSTPEGSRFLSR